MLIFHDAPPPAAEWSAIIREAWASAPVSASSSRSRSGPGGPATIARRMAPSARRLRGVNSSPKSRSPARSSLRVCQPRNTGGRGAPPSPGTAASRARLTSASAGSSRRVPPQRAQATSTAAIASPVRAVPASRASPPQARQRTRCHCPSSARAAARAASTPLLQGVRVDAGEGGASERDGERVRVQPERRPSGDRRLDDRDARPAERVQHEAARRCVPLDEVADDVRRLARPVLVRAGSAQARSGEGQRPPLRYGTRRV